MTFAPFPNGGFVLHGIAIPGTDRTFSGWFTVKAELIDCEARDGRRVGPKQVEHIARVGMRYGK